MGGGASSSFVNNLLTDFKFDLKWEFGNLTFLVFLVKIENYNLCYKNRHILPLRRLFQKNTESQGNFRKEIYLNLGTLELWAVQK